MKNFNIKKNEKGVALILTIMIMSVLLFLGMYFMTSSLTELLIAKSQTSGVRTYYLAESGINEMIWNIVNDPLYEYSFMNEDNWASTTLRIDPFGPGSGSYTVTASNTSSSHCDIVSTGLYDVGNGNFAQRIVKTNIFRAIGTSSVEDSAGYADGNITITNSHVKFLNGSAHSNNTFDVNNQNVKMLVSDDVRAVGNYLQHNNASTTIPGWIYSANYTVYQGGIGIYDKGTGTAEEIIMPAIDFSSSDPDSFRSQALSLGGYYTESDFDDEICNNMGGKINLTKKVTYIAGGVDLRGPIEIVYPPTGGVLVVEDNFRVGFKDYKTCGVKIYGQPDITFNHVNGKPSGILAGGKVQFLENTGNIYIEGVIYSNAEMDINNLDPLNSTFYVKGGVISQKLDIDSCYNDPWLTIVHDNTTLVDTIGSASSSPTIIIEHWEEEY